MSERQECIFRITNSGSSLLMVQDVVTSCGCTKVKYEAEESGRFTKVVTVYLLGNVGYHIMNFIVFL